MFSLWRTLVAAPECGIRLLAFGLETKREADIEFILVLAHYRIRQARGHVEIDVEFDSWTIIFD